jgi:peptidoglycan hydrolase-like protein with peptidoglycan-binding domain
VRNPSRSSQASARQQSKSGPYMANAPQRTQQPQYARRSESHSGGRYAAAKKAKRRGSSLPGALVSFLLRHPMDAFAVFAVWAMSAAIVYNAVYGQSGRHPAPMFGAAGLNSPKAPTDIASALAQDDVVTTASIAGNSTVKQDIVHEIQQQLAGRGMYDGSVDGVLGPRTSAAISSYESSAGIQITGEASLRVLASLKGAPLTSSATIAPAVNSRLMMVQRVLAEQGFGPIRIDGVFGDTTRQAIRRFETSRNMQVKGELTTEMVKELSKVSGEKLEY